MGKKYFPVRRLSHSNKRVLSNFARGCEKNESGDVHALMTDCRGVPCTACSTHSGRFAMNKDKTDSLSQTIKTPDPQHRLRLGHGCSA